jgi:hypothetical protein
LALPSIGKVSSAPTIEHGMIGAPVRRAAETKPPAPEALQLVALAERLADALEALGPDADQLAAGEQPLGVGVAGQRVAALAGERRDHRQREDEVGGEHPQVAVGGWWSSSASAVMSASSGTVPEWFATTSAAPVSGTLSSPRVSTRNHVSYSGRSGGSRTCSVRSASKPKSSTG